MERGYKSSERPPDREEQEQRPINHPPHGVEELTPLMGGIEEQYAEFSTVIVTDDAEMEDRELL